MKKTLALFLTSVLVLVLSACNNTEVRNSQNDTAKANNQSQSQPIDSTAPNSGTNATVNPTESTTQAELISRERAIEIALSHAGANANDVYDLDAELDREYRGDYWEVDFEYDGYEYSYEIDALTSEIIISNKERD